MTYFFDALKSDFRRLFDDENEPESTFEDDEFDHSQIAYVEYLKYMSTKVEDKRPQIHPIDMDTKIGEALLVALSHETFFDTRAHCCEESEGRLTLALADDAIENPNFRSPVILTAEGEPVAVLKQYGERTIYGIADAPMHGIYRGLFHATWHCMEPLPIPGAAPYAWTASLEDPKHIDRISMTGPIRPSIFLAPSSVRNEMPNSTSHSEWGNVEQWVEDATRFSHDDIADFVHDAMSKARSIDS